MTKRILLVLALLLPGTAWAQQVTPMPGPTPSTYVLPSPFVNGGGTALGAITIPVNGIATTSTDGLVITNNTASTAGVPVQESARLRFRSQVWNTTATAANNTNDFWIESVPVSGGTPSGLLKFGSSLNGAAATYPLAVSSSGQVYLGTAQTISNAAGSINLIQLDGSNFVQIGGNGPVGANINATTTYKLGAGSGVLAISATAPTIASGGCTSPAVTSSNGTAAFLLTIGSSCTGVKTIVLTMPAAAHFWHVQCDNNTSDAQQLANYVVGRATSTTAVTITNYTRTTGIQGDFTAADTLLCSALAE